MILHQLSLFLVLLLPHQRTTFFVLNPFRRQNLLHPFPEILEKFQIDGYACIVAIPFLSDRKIFSVLPKLLNKLCFLIFLRKYTVNYFFIIWVAVSQPTLCAADKETTQLTWCREGDNPTYLILGTAHFKIWSECKHELHDKVGSQSLA